MKALRILALLLCVQVALVALTWWPEDRSALAPRPLLAIESDDIQAISITRKPLEGEDADSVQLERDGDGWAITSSDGYPATTDKVDDLIDHLLGIEAGPPVTTTPTSWDALSVGDTEYGRRVAIRTSDSEIELVIGSAASRSLHVRRVGSPEVYRANGISEWSLRDRDASYYDSHYIDVDPASLTFFSVQRGDETLSFSRGEAGWELADLPEGSSLDADVVDAFIEGAASIRLISPMGKDVEAHPEWGLTDGVRVDWTFETEDETVTGGYVVGAKDGSSSYIKANDRAFVVKASNSKLDPLREKTRDDFLASSD